MKASTVIAVAAGFTASFVSAQDLSSIPTCALSCAIGSLGSTGCSTSDIACICKATSFVTSLIPCVQGACSPAEFETTVKAAGALCQAAGVSLTIPTATAAPTSATTSAAAEYTSATTEVSTTVVPTTTSVVSTTLTTAVSNSTTTHGGSKPTSNSTVTQPPAPSGTDNSAAGRNAVAFGSLGAIAAIVAALL